MEDDSPDFNGLTLYIGFGLAMGFITGWILALFSDTTVLQPLAANIGLALKIMCLVIPLVSGCLLAFSLFKAEPSEELATNILLIQPLGTGFISFVSSLAFFLVPILIILMVIKQVDGTALQPLIYQELTWTLPLTGLVATILAFYIASFVTWQRAKA